MAMLADDYEYVIGGDPDRDTVDLVVVETSTGAARAHLEIPTDGAGYRRVQRWALTHAPGRRVWALEGTGSFAAGLAEDLARSGEHVVEVGARRRTGGTKNDRLDATRAARTAMSRDHQSTPRVRGLREAIRTGRRSRGIRPWHQRGPVLRHRPNLRPLRSTAVRADPGGATTILER